jgi:hypothetical protein
MILIPQKVKPKTKQALQEQKLPRTKKRRKKNQKKNPTSTETRKTTSDISRYSAVFHFEKDIMRIERGGEQNMSKRNEAGKAIDRQKGHQTRRAAGGKKQKRR